MVAHHQLEIELAKIAVARAQHDELRTLAQEMIDTETQEVSDMQAWRGEWFGSSATPPMGGAAEIAALQKTSDPLDSACQDKEDVIAQLTGGVAHDFNNVLTAILGFAALTAREVPACSTAARHLSEIADAGKRAAQLTQQLLAFSRKQVLQPRVVNFDKLLSQLRPCLRTELGPAIQLVMPSAPDVSPVRIDVEQIERVMLLLAENARSSSATAINNAGASAVTGSPFALPP